jgi:hypothetical protein
VIRGGRRRLVTGFPVSAGFADAIMKTPAGRGAAFQPRFNLYVDPAWTVVSAQTAGYKPR